jgi:hypothetical protein
MGLVFGKPKQIYPIRASSVFLEDLKVIISETYKIGQKKTNKFGVSDETDSKWQRNSI